MPQEGSDAMRDSMRNLEDVRRRPTAALRSGLAGVLVAAFLSACGLIPELRSEPQLHAGAVMVGQVDRIGTAAAGYRGSSLAGATVRGHVDLFVVEAGWIAEVAYAVDGAAPSVVAAPPFATRIDTTELPDGPHVLRVEARRIDGSSAQTVDIAFIVDNAGTSDVVPANRAPSVDAGADRSVRVGEVVRLDAEVADDGRVNDEVTVSWSVGLGPAKVVFDPPDAASTRAAFWEPGLYRVRVAVDDGELRAVDTVTVTVLAPDGTPRPPTDEEPTHEPDPSPSLDPDAILWVADMEHGDLRQWSEPVEGLSLTCGGEYNNGGGDAFASTSMARGGRYAAALRIEDVDGDQGTRLFRGRCESRDHPEGLYYSTWFYVPRHHETLDGWWNVFQFKSKPLGSDAGSDPMWVLDLLDRGDGTMALRLRDKIGEGSVYYGSSEVAFPIGRWVHLEAFFRGGWEDDGAIRIWQDGVALWDMDGLDTIRPDGDIRWAVNNYTSAIRPDPSEIYVDDAVIATVRVGPDLDVATLR